MLREAPEPQSIAGAYAALPEWSLSIVSHGHMAGVRRLLTDLRHYLSPERFEIFITLNIDEPIDRIENYWPGRLEIIRNDVRKGFGANHNAALRRARGHYVAALDPELRLHGNPFEHLAQELCDRAAGIASTPVYDEEGSLTDSARRVVSPAELFRRYVLGQRQSCAPEVRTPTAVDWVAGLFMTMRRETFARLSGFDERYFLYCEDADLCVRAWNEGLRVSLVPAPMVTHAAQRKTLKRLQHFAWHCNSLRHFWSSRAYRQFRRFPPATRD